MATKTRKPTGVEKKLVGIADLVVESAQRRRDPTLAIPVRALSNVTFNERKGLIEMGKRKQARSFFTVAMAKRFMQTVLVADALCELQRAINLAFESQRMAIPKAKFIGLSSADPEAYGLPRNVGIKLNDKDIARAKELLNYGWFQKKPWQEEIKRMLGSGLKYELDALANKDFQYLTKRYLPRKLKEKDWLDWAPPAAPPCRSPRA